MHYRVVIRDDKFWKTEIEDKLLRFYKECLLLEIVDSRKNRHFKIREADYCLKAQEIKKEVLTEKDVKESDEFSSASDGNTSDSDTMDSDKFDEILEKMEEEENEDKTSYPRNKICKAETISENEEIVQQRKKVKYCEQPAEENVKIITHDDKVLIKEKFRNILARYPIKSQRERILDCKEGYLNDVSLDKLIDLINRNSNYDMISVQYLVYSDNIIPFEATLENNNRDLQIVGGGESFHWRTLYWDGKKLNIFDSRNPCKKLQILANDEKRYIERRYPNIKKEEIALHKVTRQPDGVSCGVY